MHEVSNALYVWVMLVYYSTAWAHMHMVDTEISDACAIFDLHTMLAALSVKHTCMQINLISRLIKL